MGAACSLRAGNWHTAARSPQEADHRPDDFASTVGDDIRPTLGIVARKNVFLRARKLYERASARLGAQTRFPRDYKEARRDVDKRPSVEPRRCGEHKSGDPLGELCRKFSNVARDLCGEACCFELKVLHQRGETLNDLHSSFTRTFRPSASTPA
jgi:hypothetical protein